MRWHWNRSDGGEALAGRQRSKLQVIQQAVMMAVALTLVTAVVLAIWVGWLNPQLGAGEVARVGVYLTGLYGVINLVGLGGAAAVALLLGYRPGGRVLLALAVGFWVLVNGALRHSLAVQVVSFTPHMTAVGALDALCVTLAATLVTLGIAGDRLRSSLRALAGAALIFVFLGLLHAVHERPRARDLARELPPILAETQPPKLEPSSEQLENAKLVVLGFDGLSWEILLPLLEEGSLPGFRALLEHAAYGNLATHPLTKSPLVWECISTGRPPARHGIGHHVHFEMRGLERRIRYLPYFPLGNSPMGLRHLLTYSAPWAPWDAVGADATAARAARFWEVAQRRGMRVGVYNWMNTAPAAPVRPFLYGYGTVPPRVFPPDLEAGLPPLPGKELETGAGMEWVEGKLSHERRAYERFRLLSLRHQPDLLLYYTHYSDAVNHLNWRNEAHGRHFFISGLSHPSYVPKEPVRRVMGFVDDLVADILSRMPEGATIAVVSDHGFDFRGYEHDNAPPGVFILRGPGVESGPIQSASIYDVAPTFLHLLGLPVAKDMVGRTMEVARPGGSLDRPIAWVATHGPPLPTVTASAPDPEDVRAYREYLRALGYVN